MIIMTKFRAKNACYQIFCKNFMYWVFSDLTARCLDLPPDFSEIVLCFLWIEEVLLHAHLALVSILA